MAKMILNPTKDQRLKEKSIEVYKQSKELQEQLKKYKILSIISAYRGFSLYLPDIRRNHP